MTTLTLLGDLAPVGLESFSIDRDERLSTSAIVLANLETPLCSKSLAPRPKAGPNLRGNDAAMRAIARAFPRLVVSLANNHVMDFGADGLQQTLACARLHGVRWLGVGGNLSEAVSATVITTDRIRIGLLAASDRWFGMAQDDRPGVAPLSDRMPSAIAQLRKDVDHVVVTIHGGNEMSPWPSPRWQDRLRSLVDAGASIVHAHHPHVSLGWERHCGGWVFYGLGNSLVQPALWPSPPTRRSWRAHIDLAKLDESPLVSEWEISGGHISCVRRQVPADAPDVVDRTTPLADRTLLEGLHQEYAVRLWQSFYAPRFNLGLTRRDRARLLARTARDAALSLFAPAEWTRRGDERARFYYHLFAADSHADEIATALGLLSGERTDRRNTQTRALAARWFPAEHFTA